MPFDPNELQINPKTIVPLLTEIAGERYSKSLAVIFNGLVGDKKNIPSLRYKDTPDIRDYLQKWVVAYFNGLDGRPSKRKGRPSGTVPDSLIKQIYALSHEVVPEDLLEIMAKGHATMMTLEKIVGDLLEEYLSIELASYGWHCCWGQTIKSVDFCHDDGTLLQVKTSDNSENSSSSKVRDNTGIKKWQRRKSTKQDVYYWDDLIKLTGNPNLSENGFRGFITWVLKENPGCIFVDEPFRNDLNKFIKKI